MKIVAIVQARMGSTRLPGKVMKAIGGVSMIALLLQRLARAAQIDQIMIATTDHPREAPLIEQARKDGYEVYAGSESDVLDRYYQAARQAKADIVLRITGDCPLVDPACPPSRPGRRPPRGRTSYRTSSLPLACRR